MKKESNIYSETAITEIWQPTAKLRNVERVISSSNYHCTKGLFLQQIWTSDLGKKQWRDVPTETEY